MSDFQFVILEKPGAPFPYCTAVDRPAAIRKLHALKLEHPTRFADGVYQDFDAYVEEREASYLDQPIEEITEAHFVQMLEVLPPVGWRREDGVERFMLSELTQGRITRQYVRLGNRYFSAYAALGAPETYLNRQRLEDFIAATNPAPVEA